MGNPLTQFGPPGSPTYQAVSAIIPSLTKPFILAIPPWYDGLTAFKANAAKEFKYAAKVHKTGVTPWKGHWIFHEHSKLWIFGGRGRWTTGTKTNTMSGKEEFDGTGWSIAPETMRIDLLNTLPRMMVACLNGAYSGVPQDEFANVFEFPDGALDTLQDQVYGGAIVVVEGDTGNYKYCNPLDHSIAPNVRWFNGYENFVLEQVENYIPVIEAFQNRRDMAGSNIQGFATQNLRLLVPVMKQERLRILFTVMQTLVSKGYFGSASVPTGNPSPSANQIIFGNQPNPMFGRLTVEPVMGLREDLAVMVADVPDEFAEYLGLFLLAHGGAFGTESEYVITDEPAMPNNTTVPFMSYHVFGPQSAMAFGIPGVSSAGDIGVAATLNVGVRMITGYCAQFLFTGSAS